MRFTRSLTVPGMSVLLAVGCAGPLDTTSNDGSTTDSSRFDDASVVGDACAADCNCSTPGMMRLAPCGNCGMGSETCGSDGHWSPVGTCFGQGECAVAAIDTQSLAMCAQQQRLCDATCHWGAWMDTQPAGECAAGTSARTTDGCTVPGQSHDRTCGADCHWQTPTGTCTAACTRAMPVSTSGGTPVCIPFGPFVLGADGVQTASPAQTVTLSEYYIDRYPVTRARYQMCIDAHACPTPPTTSAFWQIAAADWVFGVYFGSQQTFCRWDGGALPTEFQWEKAARGTAPDARLQTWGSTPGDCTDHTLMGTCPAWPFPANDVTFPGAVSPFGVRMMGGFVEATASHLPDGWAWLTTFTDPPDQDPSVPNPVYRGYPWYNGVGYFTTDDSAVLRGPNDPSIQRSTGFRCVY
jgi:iron(II)-dependent oxidoreductase